MRAAFSDAHASRLRQHEGQRKLDFPTDPSSGPITLIASDQGKPRKTKQGHPFSFCCLKLAKTCSQCGPSKPAQERIPNTRSPASSIEDSNFAPSSKQKESTGCLESERGVCVLVMQVGQEERWLALRHDLMKEKDTGP